MIQSFRHKGLQKIVETGTIKDILAGHSDKIARILDRLDASSTVRDMDLPGFRLHKLSGNKQDMWSVVVNGNWRITFFFEEGDAYIVDYLDYH